MDDIVPFKFSSLKELNSIRDNYTFDFSDLDGVVYFKLNIGDPIILGDFFANFDAEQNEDFSKLKLRDNIINFLELIDYREDYFIDEIKRRLGFGYEFYKLVKDNTGYLDIVFKKDLKDISYLEDYCEISGKTWFHLARSQFKDDWVTFTNDNFAVEFNDDFILNLSSDDLLDIAAF